MRVGYVALVFHVILVAVGTLMPLTPYEIPNALRRYLRLTGFEHQWNFFTVVPSETISGIVIRSPRNAFDFSPLFDDRKLELSVTNRETAFLSRLADTKIPPANREYLHRWCNDHGLDASQWVDVHFETASRKWVRRLRCS